MKFTYSNEEKKEARAALEEILASTDMKQIGTEWMYAFCESSVDFLTKLSDKYKFDEEDKSTVKQVIASAKATLYDESITKIIYNPHSLEESSQMFYAGDDVWLPKNVWYEGESA